jgi:pimeloyl-ACP methyl ester carboxylesterase
MSIPTQISTPPPTGHTSTGRSVTGKECTMAPFVLVPGAFGGAWVWQWLAPHLRAAGHTVHAITLSGMGARIDLAHPGINLDTHITDVVTALEFAELGDVVLVGWSYAGMVITGVADRVPERLAQVIYLDAVVPEDGQSSYDAEPNGEELRAADQEQSEAAGTPGWVPPPLEWIQEAVADEAVRACALARMTPHPLAAWAQPIRLTNPEAAQVPRGYIHCTITNEPAPPFLARVRSDPRWRYREIPFDHLAPVTAPRETAEMLVSLV